MSVQPTGQRMRTWPAALIWDMDGTLIDSASVVPDSFIDTVQRLGGRRHDRAEVVALYSLGEPAMMLGHMLQRTATAADIDAYHHELARRVAEPLAVAAYPGIPETLSTLSHLHSQVSLGLFTGASHQAAEILLGAAGILEYFSVIVGGDQVSHPKPHPEGIEKVAAGLDTEAIATAYIGDAPTDLTAAQRAGALAVAAAWGHLYDSRADCDLTLQRPNQILAFLSQDMPITEETTSQVPTDERTARLPTDEPWRPCKARASTIQ